MSNERRNGLRRRRRAGGKQRVLRRRLAAFREARAGRPRRQIPKAAVPSFFTLMNLFSGFMALTQILEGRLEQACWLIVLAGFFDILDGMMARLTNSQSLFGVELDSLSDIVSFGVAPAFLIYVFGLKQFGLLGLIVSSLPAICGAVRLARFNLQFEGIKKEFFLGLPIPAQAVVIVAIVLNFNQVEYFDQFSPSNQTVLMPIIVLLSGLMISNIRFDALPKPTPQFIRANPVKSVLYLVGIVLIVFLHQIGLLISLAVYLGHGIGRALLNFYRAIVSETDDALDLDDRPVPESR